MRRFVTLAVVWIVLFGITLGVRALTAKGEGRRAEQDDTSEMKQARDELTRKPRRNAFDAIQEASGDPVFEAALTATLQANADGLKACRQQIIDRLSRASEYFEVSFIARLVGDDASRDQPKIRLSGIVLERASVWLRHEEEQCIVNAFKKIELVSSSVPSGRVATTFCFKGNPAI